MGPHPHALYAAYAAGRPVAGSRRLRAPSFVLPAARPLHLRLHRVEPGPRRDEERLQALASEADVRRRLGHGDALDSLTSFVKDYRPPAVTYTFPSESIVMPSEPDSANGALFKRAVGVDVIGKRLLAEYPRRKLLAVRRADDAVGLHHVVDHARQLLVRRRPYMRTRSSLFGPRSTTLRDSTDP